MMTTTIRDKKPIRLLRLLMLVAVLVAGAGGAWGETVTRNYAATYGSKTGVAEAVMPMVKITYGSGTWTSYSNTYNTGRGVSYTRDSQIDGGAPRNGATILTFTEATRPAIPDNGSYVMLEPLVNGTILLDYKENDAVSDYCLLRVNGTTIDDYLFIAHDATQGENKTLTFAAEAGKKYYFFANGVTTKFFGFSFQYERERLWDVAAMISANSIANNTPYSSFPRSGSSGDYRYPTNTGKISLAEGSGYLTDLAFHTDAWRILSTTALVNSIQNTAAASRMLGIKGVAQGEKLIVQSSEDLNTANYSGNTNAALAFTQNGNYYVGTIPSLSTSNMGFFVNQSGGISSIELVAALPHFSPAYTSYRLGSASGFVQPTLYNGAGSVVANSSVTYTSSNQSVVKVSADGHSYTPVGVGTATISVTVGGKTATLEVNVTSPDLAWTSTKAVTVSLLDADNNNHVDDLLPTLYKATGNTISYTPNTQGENAAWFATSEWESRWGATLYGKPRIRKPGTVTLTATDATTSESTSFSLTITDPGLTTGRYIAASNSYEFPTTGRLVAGATISSVAGVTMQYGNGTDLPVVVNSGGKTVVKLIDGNGFSHPNLNGGVIPIGGTYYKFVAAESGTLYVSGVFATPKLYKSDNTENPLTADGSDYKADLTAGNTYYLYNNDSNQPMLHSFRYESQVDITVGSSQWKFRNNTFADEIGDKGDGYWTYSSSNTSVLSFDDDTYGNATKTGVATINGVGYATVTATKDAVSKTYYVKVKKDDWDDLSVSTEGITITGSHSNVTGGIHPTGVPFTMSVPAIAGQTFKFVAGKTGSGGYNHNIYLSNTSTDSYRLNNQNTDNTWTSTVDIGAYNVELSINDAADDGARAISGGTYIKNIHTNFPQNSISFGSATYKVGYLLGSAQTGQLATTANSSYNVLYVSNNPSVAEVHPFTGRITVQGGSAGKTVTITAYNLGEVGKYNGNSTAATYTLHIGAASEFQQAVNVEDLMYMPGRTAAGGGLARTIPYLNITYGDNDAAISSGTSAVKLFHKGSNNGSLTITPRYNSSTKLTMNSLTLTFSEAPKAGDQLTINETLVDLTTDLTQTFNAFTSGEAITVAYASIGNGVSIRAFQVGGTATSGTAAELLTATKATPTLTYSTSSYKVAVGYTADAVMPTTNDGFKNLRGISYALTDANSHFTLSGDKLTAVSATGSDAAATLTASFAETYLFNAASSVTCSFTAIESEMTPAVAVSNKLLTYSTSDINAFAFTNEALTLSATIGGTAPTGYTVRYTVSDDDLAVVNSDGSVTTLDRQGLVTITANFIPDAPTTNPILTATTNVYVLSGQWDFSTITNTVTNTMQSAPTGWSDDPWHKSGSSNGSTRDTKDYQPIQMDTGDPLPQSIALQTAYAVRMFNGGAIHLYGHNHTAYTASNGDVGGVLRVPVRRGMTVTITAYNNTGENEEITLSGLNNLENTDEATTFLVNTGSTTESFIANKDGYIDIINSTANVNLFIQSVNVSNDIVFQYGNETYVKAGTSPFVNPVLNAGSSTLAYTFRNVANTQATGINATGAVTFDSGYGIFEVTAAATGGSLDGQSSSYQATVIGFTLVNSSDNLPAEGTKTIDLKDKLTIESGNTFGDDNSTAATDAEAAIKDKVVFAVESATTFPSLSGSSLTVEGAGTVTIRATLGAISETFTYTLTGASLDVANAVISREKIYDNTASKYIYRYPNSYTITLNTAETGVTQSAAAPYSSSHWFDIGRMKENAMGSIRSKVEANALIFTENENTLTISGFDDDDAFTNDLECGGVIPIYASYTYNGETHQVEGTLTIAYAKHTWNFEHNLISGDNTAAGVAAHINDGLAKWYSATPSTKEGKWTSTATFDMPTDAGDDEFATGTADDNHTNSHLENHDWKFVRKMKDAHRESAIIYYYNHDIYGQNALVIPETQGLHIQSAKNSEQLGVEMASERVTRTGDDYTAGWGKPLFYTRTGTSGTDPGYTYTQVSDATNTIFNAETGELVNGGNFLGNSTQTYYASNIMLLNGGKITIPGLQKGQWVEVRWTRHQDDLGERLRMTNLSDAEGTAITSTYKIGNCFYNLPYSTSTYMFQATEAGDVTFEVTDNVYISIQQIELHDPDWDYTSNFVEKLNGFVNDIDKDDASRYYTDDYYKNDKGVLTWGSLTTTTAPKVKWQYVWDDQGSHTITILPKALQNAPNAPQTWTFTMDDMLKRSGAVMEATGSMDQPATITYNGGWGKVKVTMTSWTQNMKYVANKKSWTITFGQAPKQTYPYTWDFTKFFANTPTSLGNDLTWDGDRYTGSSDNIFVAVYNGHSSSDYSQWPNTYDTPDYQSYYVEGAQLVSYNLRGTNNGVLRETEGLGFELDTDGNRKPNNNMLLLNMVKTVGASGKSGDSRQTWETGTDHTTTSHLTIASGGKMIVPRPNDAVNYSDYYIYIRSSVAPSAFTNVTYCSSDAEVPTGVYKYQFNANANAEFTFTNDSGDPDTKLNANLGVDNGQSRKYTDIYAVAVTKDFKDFKRLNGKGWATESRDYAVDYTLDSLLTTRPVWAHPIIARSSNPMYSDNKTKTTVRLMDRGYVVPANQGLVLKQVTSSPGSDGSTYSVPLFAPAVTTAVDVASQYNNNLMRPNLTERTFTTERENADGTENAAGEYTRFILSEKYMTWRKEGSSLTTYDDHFTAGSVPGFYRMHIYDSGTSRNTLDANKAYLRLLSDRINEPIWATSPAAPGRQNDFDFVGIEGISDFVSPDTRYQDNRTYNLRGQAVEEPLLPGVYIRNGKKIIVK